MVGAQAKAERDQIATTTQAAREQALAEAKAAGVRAVGLAEGEAEAARLGAYRDLRPEVLYGLALRELAGDLPQIGQLTVTPDMITELIGRLKGSAGS